MDALSGLLQAKGAGLAQVGFIQIFPRMLAAVAIGTVVAVRPWRWVMRKPLPKQEMIHAQILLCAAAAVIVAVIGDSLAKAFGLVGLGSFVRFRSGLKDPRDAAVFFVTIGLGMACGHGSLELAAVAGGLVSVLMMVLDYFGAATPAAQRIRVVAAAEDVTRAEAVLRAALSARNVVVRACVLDMENRRMELDVEERVPGGVAAAMGSVPSPPWRALTWTTLAPADAKEQQA